MEVSTIIGIGLIINGTGFVFIILILLRILATVRGHKKKEKRHNVGDY
jgi:Na+-transporting methylmalonyl-CoA/oxaloacetate decarboxylase gamma subunit